MFTMSAKSTATLVIVVTVLFSCMNECRAYEDISRVLLISLDGFRWDYLDIVHNKGFKTPTFDTFIANGVSISSPGLTNAFITKTFPNHYTIVTGQYEEDHGVVANDFYDPVFNESFNLADPAVATNIKWWNGTGSYPVVPIWMTNEQAARGSGHPRSSGVYMWPGSEVIGQRPTFFKNYNSSVPFDKRVDELVSWFTDEVKPINFGVLYMPEPDGTGHHFGPDSTELANKIVELDGNVKYLFDQLDSHGLLHGLNIILTSDHGMESLNSVIYLSEFVNSSLYISHAGSPIMHIWPKSGHIDEVYSRLKAVKNATILRREEIPERFHYKDNRRVSPIVMIADTGFQLCVDHDSCYRLKGDHGYDNKMSVMHPIFIARGPAFKKNYVATPFETVNIYALLCHLLDIEPRPNNGTLDAVKHILADDDNLNLTMISFVLVVGFAALISAVWCIVACRSQRYNRRSRVEPLRMDSALKTTGGSKPLLVSDEEDDIA